MKINKTRVGVLSAISTGVLAIAFAIPANASSGLCWPSGAPSTARLSVTEYNTSYYSGSTKIIQYTYHMDVNSAGYFKKWYINFNDGYLNTNVGTDDVYIKTGHNSAGITGYWKETVNPGTEFQYTRTRSCYIYISAL